MSNKFSSISPNLRAIPNWHLSGNPSPPEILSNKIILTPPAPGNQRGAIWSEGVLQHSEWTVDIDFRATGPERGGGNLQIWYARDGPQNVGTASVYTVGRFDGLVLVVDQYAGSGGYVRGFLNDGSTDYRAHQAVDSIAFGHCQYSYRNLGRPSRIAIKHTNDAFRVSVDGTLCFESDKIKLPLGYNFGITAASAENPDSFEIMQFVTTTEQHTPDIQDPNQGQNQQYISNENQNQEPPQNQRGKGRSGIQAPQSKARAGDIPAFSDPPEEPASNFHSSAEQFADLHNRLQIMMKHISAANRDHNTFQTETTTRHTELMSSLGSLTSTVSRLASSIQGLENKLEAVHKDVKSTKNELHASLDRHFNGMRHDVRNTEDSLMGHVNKHAFGWGKVLGVVALSQIVSVGAYLLYKKRKASTPKKYL
jgi:mannose-binding lectin 1